MVTLADIETAHKRIKEHIYLSPCAHSETLSRICGCKLHLKLENLQMTGSFKDRGALNKMLQLNTAQRAQGVVTASAGNHAQGVAHAARLLGIKATIVMPETTPLAKIRGTRELEANILLHGESYDQAYEKALSLQQSHQYTFIHAFNDDQIIAGQGTIGLELLEQVPDMDVVVLPIGGGGLGSGISLAIKSIRPEVRIIGVEAQRMPSMQKSISAGHIVAQHTANTLADGIAVANVGERTFPIISRYIDHITTVSEEEIANAIMVLLDREKTLAEGAGACAYAALHNKHIENISGKNVVVLVTGGNIDMTMLSRILERGLELEGYLARLKVIMPDKPGSIARLAAITAEHMANILHINQNRSVHEVELEETEVEISLETRGRDHVIEIVAAIQQQGFTVRT